MYEDLHGGRRVIELALGKHPHLEGRSVCALSTVMRFVIWWGRRLLGVLEEWNMYHIRTAVCLQLLDSPARRRKADLALNPAMPPRISHPYPLGRAAGNHGQRLRGLARIPQGLLGGQIVGRNERLQIPERLLQDALGAYQLLLMVTDKVLRQWHGSAALALDRA